MCGRSTRQASLQDLPGPLTVTYPAESVEQRVLDDLPLSSAPAEVRHRRRRHVEQITGSGQVLEISTEAHLKDLFTVVDYKISIR